MKKEIIIETLPGFQPKANIGRVCVKVGDKIGIGDTILTIEGKKGNKDVVSDYGGEVLSIEVEEGSTINKGALLAVIEAEEIEQEEVGLENEDVDTRVHSENLEAEIVVLGGGPGGYVAAIRASQRGKNVILIEEDKLGGTCLNRGCIPTKAMVETNRVRDLIKSAEVFGLENPSGEVSMEKLMARKDGIVETLVSGIESSMDKHKVKVLNGRGVAFDKNTLSVSLKDKNVLVKFENLILAPGSLVDIPDFNGADGKDILTSNELLDLKEVPESLIILGGRVIAMEFAFIYSKLGSKVTVIQRSDSIFPNLDKDIVDLVKESALENGINLIEGTRVKSIRSTVDGGKAVIIDHKGEEKIVVGSKLAIATGRKPNIEGLNLDRLGVDLDSRGRAIKVDGKMRTNIKNIYAIGDATNIYNLAHVASKQALVAVENILGNEIDMDYSAVPEAIFTDPEIGIVGRSEKDCKEEGIDYILGDFPYSNNGKSLVANETNGFIKVIAEKKTRKIIGASLVGLLATDLLSVFTNLIANGNTIDEAKDVIYAHPTVAETAFEAILDLDNESIHK